MSSTNKTSNYQLSQFVGTDIPSILNDYNGDMRKIDSAIHDASVAGGDNATAIAELQTTVGRHTTEISGINNTVNNVSGRVVSIESMIPSDASSSNQLLTNSDLENLGYKEVATISHTAGTTLADSLKKLGDILVSLIEDGKKPYNIKVGFGSSFEEPFYFNIKPHNTKPNAYIIDERAQLVYHESLASVGFRSSHYVASPTVSDCEAYNASLDVRVADGVASSSYTNTLNDSATIYRPIHVIAM